MSRKRASGRRADRVRFYVVAVAVDGDGLPVLERELGGFPSWDEAAYMAGLCWQDAERDPPSLPTAFVIRDRFDSGSEWRVADGGPDLAG